MTTRGTLESLAEEFETKARNCSHAAGTLGNPSRLVAATEFRIWSKAAARLRECAREHDAQDEERARCISRDDARTQQQTRQEQNQ